MATLRQIAIALLYGTIKRYLYQFFGGFLTVVPEDLLMAGIGWLISKYKADLADIGDALLISGLSHVGFDFLGALMPRAQATAPQPSDVVMY